MASKEAMAAATKILMQSRPLQPWELENIIDGEFADLRRLAGELLEALDTREQDHTTILAWLKAQYVKERDGYRAAEKPEEIPDGYGDYSVYDGLHLLAGGCSRNLRATYLEHEPRLRDAEFPIFLWSPDADGSTEKWLNWVHPDPEEPIGQCGSCER